MIYFQAEDTRKRGDGKRRKKCPFSEDGSFLLLLKLPLFRTNGISFFKGVSFSLLPFSTSIRDPFWGKFSFKATKLKGRKERGGISTSSPSLRSELLR